MTNRELFERFAGGMVRRKDREERYMLRGYYNEREDYVVIEAPHGGPIALFGGARFTLMPDIPITARLSNDPADWYDWDTVVVPDEGPNWCCRCGKSYSNRKTHRKVCK